MGLVCATPTAGSAGCLPAVLTAATQKLGLNRQQQLDFLLTAGAFGLVIANNASISGAEGGCQAEVGSASAMSAAALTLAAGGTPYQASQAVCFVIKNMLGLICDPVAGLVEVPCVKRNAMGASYAFIAADMALAGIESKYLLMKLLTPCTKLVLVFRLPLEKQLKEDWQQHQPDVDYKRDIWRIACKPYFLT